MALQQNKMATKLVMLIAIVAVIFRCTVASPEETDNPDFVQNVSVRILGKEDENTTMYKNYMEYVKRREEEKLVALQTSKNDSLNDTNSTNFNETRKAKWFCSGREMSPEHANRVLLVNDSVLLRWINSSSNVSDGCAIVMFYAKFCPFSASIAPQFNAFGRAYNNTPVLAVDAYKYSSVNARYGVVAVPTILIFHAGKPVLKFNHSKTLDDLRMFVKNYTGLEGNATVNVTDQDYIGPVSSIATKETDIYLILSTTFIILFGIYLFSQTAHGEQVREKLVHFVDWTKVMQWFKNKQE